MVVPQSPGISVSLICNRDGHSRRKFIIFLNTLYLQNIVLFNIAYLYSNVSPRFLSMEILKIIELINSRNWQYMSTEQKQILKTTRGNISKLQPLLPKYNLQQNQLQMFSFCHFMEFSHKYNVLIRTQALTRNQSTYQNTFKFQQLQKKTATVKLLLLLHKHTLIRKVI